MQQLSDLFAKASFIRAFELHIAVASEAGHVPGLVHLCSGAELVEGALCGFLTGPRDQITGSHRSHGLALAMGADPTAVAAEILGREGGLSKARGGTQHLIAPESGFLASNGIVGAQVPIAAGAALSAKTQKTGGIALAFFGDGAANQGAVLETMNIAVALSLPLLFVLENNGLGQSTSSKYASGGADMLARAKSFGLKSVSMNGYDGADCLKVAAAMTDYVRASGKPAFIEAKIPRLSGHYFGEKADYLAHHEADDPLESLAEKLGVENCSLAQAAAEKAAHEAVADALNMAEAILETASEDAQ